MITTLVFDPDIATAPGVLPLAEILAREGARRTQFRHDNTISPLGPGPGQPVAIEASSGESIAVRAAAVFYTTDGSAPSTASTRVQMAPRRVDWQPLPGYLTCWSAELPGLRDGTVVRYRIGGWGPGSSPSNEPDYWAQDGQGMWFRQTPDTGITTFAYRVEAAHQTGPDWIRDAVIYQIFLDRFHPGTPDGIFPGPADTNPRAIHGGTLRGVEMALSYLTDLGITCLWLSPLQAAASYHRYDAIDGFIVDPRLGSNDDLRRLTDAAHARGMKIMLDFVPSHVSSKHPAFVAAQRDRDAPTANWFTFDEWPNRYRMFLGMSPSLPSLNADDPGARAYLFESAAHWLRDCGADAFRLDHAIGPSMDFWVAFRQATRAVLPEVFSVGEITDTPDCLRRYRQKLDGALDFPLATALRLTFGSGAWSVARFDTFLDDYERYMADGPSRVSFLDNHDMNRFLFVAGNDVARLKVAALCQLTLSGPPVIYYGTEIGLSQAHDAEDHDHGGDANVRQDMPWNEAEWDRDVLDLYRRLIHFRHAHPVLCSGTRRGIYLDEETQSYAYLREEHSSSGDPILCAFNLGDQNVTISALGAVQDTAVVTDPGVQVENGRLVLPPLSAAAVVLPMSQTPGVAEGRAM